MPFPNFHAARQVNPDKFVENSFRTISQGFPKGITAIVGTLKETEESEIQSFRFDRRFWTPDQARAWLKERKHKTTLEVATNKSLWSGLL